MIISILYTETPARANNREKIFIFKNCDQYPDYIDKINNTQVDNAKDIDVVKLMYNFIEYRDISSEMSGSLGQYYKDELILNNDGAIIVFLLNLKKKRTGKMDDNGTKDVK